MLYLVGTPIGNFNDMTYRAVETLKNVDLIAAEDTRNTLNLLNHFDIKTKITSYHEHNKSSKGQQLLEMLLEGKDVAIVTDAGMPAISDPGEDIVKLCIDNNIEVTTVPGPTAFVSALVMSGLPTKGVVFEGFLSAKNSEREKRLTELKEYKETVIFYEAPHKLLRTLEHIKNVFGDRDISVSREITKKFEETIRGKISDVIKHFTENNPKGEFVLVLSGAEEKEEVYITSVTQHVDELISQGMDKKTAIAEVAKLRKIPKRNVYNEYENQWLTNCKQSVNVTTVLHKYYKITWHVTQDMV